MGTLAADLLAEFHEDQNELDVAQFLSGDEITNYAKGFEDLEIFERSAEFRFTVAARDIPVGKVIGMFDGVIESKCTRYTYAIGENVHVRNSTCLVLINHSCSPNTVLKFPGPSAHASEFTSLKALAEAYPEEVFPVFVAIAPIAKGEEVTWNYLSTEWEMSCPFECQCSGGRDCVGTVGGAKHLTPAQKTRMSPLMAPHILRQMEAWESDTAIHRLGGQLQRAGSEIFV